MRRKRINHNILSTVTFLIPLKRKRKYFSIQYFPISEGQFFFKFPRIRLFVLVEGTARKPRLVGNSDVTSLIEEKRNNWRNPIQVPYFPPRISHGLARDQTRTSLTKYIKTFYST